MSAKMNWKKWRVGLCLALFSGLFSAAAGLLADMSWKSFLAVLGASMLTNLTNYLMRHPVEDIDDGSAEKQPENQEGTK